MSNPGLAVEGCRHFVCAYTQGWVKHWPYSTSQKISQYCTAPPYYKLRSWIMESSNSSVHYKASS